ncbi:transient receptor potential cation channel subfamily M member-like 2 isoform X3 [Tachypleus tridentatus]|uniref:transient receptor potential cation channel subfamily M member-like 2 isoform X3 n=1 Tax=Tachypleus tridentatus TaxID=6853 RepID=UPI003FD63142
MADELVDETIDIAVQDLRPTSRQKNEADDVDLQRQKSNVSRLSRAESITPTRYLAGKGAISFWKNFEYEQQGPPFIRISHNIAIEEVAEVVYQEWDLSSPRIVLVIVSNVAPLTSWKNARQLENFQKGLIKAANTTNMWIVTNGTNIGATKVIGDAVRDELLHRQTLQCHKHPNQSVTPSNPLTLIGISREDWLVYSDMFDGRTEIVQLENEGNIPEDNKFELNPDHSHFVVVKDETIAKTGNNYFLLRLEQYLAAALEIQQADEQVQKVSETSKNTLGSSEVPVVAILIQGGYDCVRFVLDHLKKQFPVVIIRGSGGLADLLAYAYSEFKHRAQSRWDVEFIENFLKPELSNKIVFHFPKLRENSLARNMFRDRILECVRHAQQQQQIYLTVLNIHSNICNLKNLDQHILQALFKSQKPEKNNWHEQMQKDLLLTLDWNNPRVALTEVFRKDPSNKFKITKDMFEQSLLRPDREEFVNLFLSQGFQVHKFLTPRRLKLLFMRVQNQEFFHSVCWEGILGHGHVFKFGKFFIENDLNWLISILTGFSKYIDPQGLSLNAMGMYVTDHAGAERRALTILTMWAVCTNKSKLTEILWRHSDQPIHLGLVVSMMFERLESYVSESGLKTEMIRLQKEFADKATRVLDVSYKEATCRAYDVLNEESPEWEYKTAVELAADFKIRIFLSHPCCQKWLTNMFLGNIRIRELTWGVVTFPQWVKVIMCAFLIFPMYIWVRFKVDPRESWNAFKDISDLDSDDDKDEREGDEDILLKPTGQCLPVGVVENNSKGKKKKHLKDRMGTLREREVFIRSSPSIWRMVYLMWSAPITKFWTFQIFYMFYLGMFSLAVLWPSCGNIYLDSAVCIWTALIVLETVRRTYMLYRKVSSIPLFLKVIEILLMVTFVCLYSLGRIFYVGSFLSPYTSKVLLCVALLYFYYRLIAIYLPISPTLGPLLYRVKLMVVVDFVNFMRMTLLVIISGGIVIHAVLYPDYPLSAELFRRTFHRAWFSMYLTPIGDLEGNEECHQGYQNISGSCYVGKYSDFTCPTTGAWPYIFSIQYFVLLKLILLTLLYALFSATASKIQNETEDIWKFQRYQLVVDFANRLRLPAPLNIISYVLIIFEWTWRLISCRPCKNNRKRDEDGEAVLISDKVAVGCLTEKDYNYWRQLAQEYSTSEEEKAKEENLQKKQMELLTTIAEDVEYEKNVLRQVKGRVGELERMLMFSQVFLESIKHMNQREEEHSQGSVHFLARHTPYPGTIVQRFPVPDKYVAWEVMWIDYDPVAYSRPRSDFPLTLQPHVDEDLLLLREKQGTVLPTLQWNSLSTNPAGITIDRQSWIIEGDGMPLVYKLDREGVPRNPRGRTGLRGRGALPRWGPNHYVIVVVTRWQNNKIVTPGGKGLELVVLRTTEKRDQISLPGGFIPGDQKYEVMRALFKVQETGTNKWKTEQDLVQFMKNCSIQSENLETMEGDSGSQQDVKCDIILKGYMDDPWNTDQAWREVELWHVHYSGVENVADKLQPSLGWRIVTDDVFIKLPAGQAALLQEITHRLQPMIL